jgi:hypothetical protein
LGKEREAGGKIYSWCLWFGYEVSPEKCSCVEGMVLQMVALLRGDGFMEVPTCQWVSSWLNELLEVGYNWKKKVTRGMSLKGVSCPRTVLSHPLLSLLLSHHAP